MQFPKGAIRVEVSFLTEPQGGRRTAAHLSDGRYRTVVIAGSRNELSENEAMGRGQYKLFGVGSGRGMRRRGKGAAPERPRLLGAQSVDLSPQLLQVLPALPVSRRNTLDLHRNAAQHRIAGERIERQLVRQ